MNLVESFRIAIRALNANKVRAALTMLGVIIGVAAVILLVAIGSGVQQEITGQIEGLGSNLLFVFPATSPAGAGAVREVPEPKCSKRFTIDDADLLERRSASEAIVVPVVQGPARLKAGNRTSADDHRRRQRERRRGLQRRLRLRAALQQERVLDRGARGDARGDARAASSSRGRTRWDES